MMSKNRLRISIVDYAIGIHLVQTKRQLKEFQITNKLRMDSPPNTNLDGLTLINYMLLDQSLWFFTVVNELVYTKMLFIFLYDPLSFSKSR